MKRLRRNLIFCLAGLCAVFAAVAASFRMSGFRRGAASWTGEMFYNRKFPESTEWGQRLEILARQNRKLVFFTVKGARRYVPDADFEKLLERHFYVTELDPYQCPPTTRFCRLFSRGERGCRGIWRGESSYRILRRCTFRPTCAGIPKRAFPPCPRPRRPLPKNFLTPRRARGGSAGASRPSLRG